MTHAERAVLIAELTERLAELTTAEKLQLLPFHEHLTDLIEKLEMDA